MPDMLGGITLAQVAGLFADFNRKLLGDDGEEWLSAFRCFLRKENPWPEPKIEVTSSSGPLWRKIDENTIEVNLDYPLKMPSKTAMVEWNLGKTGKAIVERKSDNLFVDGQEVQLYISSKQMEDRSPGSSIYGLELRHDVTQRSVPHVNIMDALLENPHLLPDSWRHRDHRFTIFFWSVGFRSPGGALSVRYLHWSIGKGWDWRSFSLLRRCDSRCPAAILAS